MIFHWHLRNIQELMGELGVENMSLYYRKNEGMLIEIKLEEKLKNRIKRLIGSFYVDK